MTPAIPPTASAARSSGGPSEAVLVRVALNADTGTDVPPAPEGSDVTVSFSSPGAAGSARRLQALGYRYVGLSPVTGGSRAVADFLVPQALVEENTSWWRAMTRRADRVFAVGFGPVQAALRDVLRVHRQSVR